GEQHVVQRLAAALGGVDEDLELLLDARLADELRQAPGAERLIELVLRSDARGLDPLVLGDLQVVDAGRANAAAHAAAARARRAPSLSSSADSPAAFASRASAS